MAVITKYFVVREGVELDQVFIDKKEAVAYDAMLDAADKLSEFLKQVDLGVEIAPEMIDKISVALAKKAPEVSKILKGIKPLPTEKKKPKKAAAETDSRGQGEGSAAADAGDKPKDKKKR